MYLFIRMKNYEVTDRAIIPTEDDYIGAANVEMAMLFVRVPTFSASLVTKMVIWPTIAQSHGR